MTAGLEAEVALLDRNVDRLRHVDQIQMGRITTLTSNRGQIERTVVEADLLIGAVLVPGGRAPVLVDESLVKSMKDGAVVVDIAIDQGGCIATSRETTHQDPVYEVHGVLHYCVGNMPGAVPNTSTYALTNVTLPHVVELSRLGIRAALAADESLAHGVNTLAGDVVNRAVADALGEQFTPLSEVLAAAPS
jgi:alanine dehydrogenase